MSSSIGMYEKLGVRRVINAWGVGTELGGWTPTQSVIRAMDEANSSQVEMIELLQKSGDFIADLLGVEAALVTSGAAAAQALSVAACMAGTDPDKIGRLPDTTSMKNEVVIQKPMRYMFDRCYTLTGATLVEAGTEEGCSADDLESVIGANTAAVAYYIQPEYDPTLYEFNPRPKVPMLSIAEVREIAGGLGIPLLGDACSQVFPLEYFRESAQSADLVSFGGKYIGGPHSTGFVCGRRDLVEAVEAQGFVAYHYDGARAVGRAMKVDRQEIVGLVQAVDDWFNIDHEERILEYHARFSTVREALSEFASVNTRIVEVDHYVPQMLLVEFDPSLVRKTAEEIRLELDTGNPRVWIGALNDETLWVVVHTMNPGETEVVTERLRRAFKDSHTP